MRTPRTGTRAAYTHTVRTEDSATHWGNELPVLATPVLLWLGEIACMKVVEDALDEGEMTVGYAHTDARHLAATPVGWTVTVEATLTRAEDGMLTFEVEARDAQDVVFRGTHVRALIERERFVRRFDRKALRGETAEARP
ncbi:thioesterase family protein [Streptomyces sp. NPDC015232]|uniref:thioesterase family protein n=1 Tax=unclassified Streptomyces TaxID=2593676 RepID=UPI0036FC0AD4